MLKKIILISIIFIGLLEAATLNTNKATYTSHENITASYKNTTNGQRDWIAIYPKNSSNAWANVIQWKWIKGKVNGSSSFTKLPAGEYEVRVFFNNTFQDEAKKAFRVSDGGGAETTVNTNKITYTSHENIIATYKDTTNGQRDWIAIYPKNSSNAWANVIQWKWIKGKVNGSSTFTKLPVGEYEVRVFFNNTFQDEAKKAFRVSDDDLLKVSNDNTGQIKFHSSKVELFPHNTHGIIRTSHYPWNQGIAVMPNGYYVSSLNLREKNNVGKYVEKYILFNLFDPNGKSIGNVQVDYPSHGQDLSIEQVNNNLYYLYSHSPAKGTIAKFIFKTNNINFDDIKYNDVKLDIKYDKRIFMDNQATFPTSSINEEKNTFVTVGYLNTIPTAKKLTITTRNKANNNFINNFKFDISAPNMGFYNQGIAMSHQKIYLLRGHWLANDDGEDKQYSKKKLYVFNANNGDLINSYTFDLKKHKNYIRIEPEGLTIVNNQLYVCLATRGVDNKNSRRIRLFKLLDKL
jgi:hypothetical protein